MNAQNVAQPSAAGKSRLAICINSSPNTNAGILLYRVAHWDRFNLRKGKADRWAANSVEDWSEDTGLSYDQIKRALTALRTANLIETRRGFFGGRSVLHVRLSQRSIALIEWCKSAPIEQCKSAPSHIQEEQQKEQQKDFGELSLTVPKSEENPSAFSEGSASVIPEDKEVSVSNAKTILAELQEKKVQHGASDKLTLAQLFTELYAEASGKFAPILTVKQKAILKGFDKKVSPHGKAVLRRCCRNWPEFCEKVRQTAGKKHSPELPTVEFLSAYAHIAVSFTPKADATPVGPNVEKPKDKFGGGFTMKKVDPDA